MNDKDKIIVETRLEVFDREAEELSIILMALEGGDIVFDPSNNLL